MPLNRRMADKPQAGDYWAERFSPTVWVADVKPDGNVVVITDWIRGNGSYPDFSRARELSHCDFVSLLRYSHLDKFVCDGLRNRAVPMQWVDVWREDYRGNYAMLNDEFCGTDCDEERYTTVH